MTKQFEKEKLRHGKFIARGTFGAVFQGDYDGKKVAVKLLDFGNNLEEEDVFKQEASLWSKLSHPNVANFIGASQLKLSAADLKRMSGNKLDEGKQYWCMVSEFLEGGTLFSYLCQNMEQKLPLSTVIQLALDVARGLVYLHSEKVVHRDVKTMNMALDGKRRVKLIDFGLSRKEASNPSEMTGKTGTELYMAPEVRQCGPYDHKCDVFSFGICLWEIFYCRLAEIMPMSNRPYIHDDCPKKLADLMSRCWLDVEMRPDMPEVVKALEEMMITATAPERAKKKKNLKGCFSFLGKS